MRMVLGRYFPQEERKTTYFYRKQLSKSNFIFIYIKTKSNGVKNIAYNIASLQMATKIRNQLIIQLESLSLIKSDEIKNGTKKDSSAKQDLV
jgi:hypothetical protein